MLSSDDRSRNQDEPQSELKPPVPGPAAGSFTVPLPSMPNAFEQEGIHPLPAQFELLDTPQLPFPDQSRKLAVPTQADMLSALTSTLQGEDGSTASRQPIVIAPTMKKAASAPLTYKAHKKRRLVVTLVGVILLLAITSGTLFAASPMGRELGIKFNPRLFSSNLVANQNLSVNSLVAQATATATYHQNNDGYDPYANGTLTVSNGSGSLNWPRGYCTYWANYEYHKLANYWVSWSGNADLWVQGAQKAGWDVSTTPHVYSIIVLMPGRQGAGNLGHVAVVLSASGNSAYTSTMNWYANGGGFDIVSNYTFTTGPGVYFIWHP